MKNTLYISFLCILFASCNSNKNYVHYRVTSEAMLPTINPGDYVIMDTSINKFTHGDIVGFKYEGDEYVNTFEDIFRIVGLPEDSIATENEICIINGKKNKTKYLGGGYYFDEYEEEFPNGLKIIINYYPLDNENVDLKPIKVPEDHYLILCDSRTGAIDSRYFGPVHKDKITGKLIKVIKGDE